MPTWHKSCVSSNISSISVSWYCSQEQGPFVLEVSHAPRPKLCSLSVPLCRGNKTCRILNDALPSRISGVFQSAYVTCS